MLALEVIEGMVNKARNNYKSNRDPQAKAIEAAENTINTRGDAVTLSKAVAAGFLAHPAGTSRYYILLAP